MSDYKETLLAARIYLREHGIADADVDAWYLLAYVFGLNRVDFFLQQSNTVEEDKAAIFMELVRKRASHIPLQYITGTQEFMGLEFSVSEDVLIPRQDTEILVEEVLKVCKHKTVLDMCTGSGCIITSLAKLGNLEKAVGVDISEKALHLAKQNAMKHDVKVQFIQSDLFLNVECEYDIIVSNPPYIPTNEINQLMPEVKDYEPVLALDGSYDGLFFYCNIVASLKGYLKENGLVFFEIGHNQGMDVKELLQSAGYYDIRIIQDLSGLDRVIYGKKR